MQWSDQSFLKKAEMLHARGLRFELKAGLRLARRFADLGYEEYLVLPDLNILSLFRGDSRALPEEELPFFFLLPTADYLIDQIDRLGYDILRLDYVDRRIWRLELKTPEQESVKFENRRFEEVFLDAYAALMPNQSDF